MALGRFSEDMMVTDSNGREIRIGDRVRHKHEPLPVNDSAPGGNSNDAARFHMFFGSAEVIGIFGPAVIVKASARGQIPVYLGELVTVVS